MTTLFRQSLAASLSSLRGVHRRLGLSLSMALSIALVVLVLSGFLALAAGFERALSKGGAEDIAVILGGAREEAASSLPPEAINAIAAGLAPNTMLSRELVTAVDLPVDSSGTAEAVALRGMDAAGMALRRSSIRLEGSGFARGHRDLVVGAGLAALHPELAPGKTLRLGPVSWTVIGIFHADNAAMEQEIWTDLDDLQAAFDRQNEVQSLRVPLGHGARLQDLETLAAGVTQTRLLVLPEPLLHAAEAEGRTRLIRLFGWPLSLLMAVGAAAGALNSIMSSIASRRVEIATFRLIGFGRRSLVLAVLAEALLLSTLGTALGLGLAILAFNGLSAGTVGSNGARLAFELAVTPAAMLQAGLLGLGLGMIGGVLPALHAVTQPVLVLLRQD